MLSECIGVQNDGMNECIEDVRLMEGERVITVCGQGVNEISWMVPVMIGSIYQEGLLDTGSQVCLVNERVLEQLQLSGEVVVRERVNVQVHGIGGEFVQSTGMVNLKVALGSSPDTWEIPFIVMRSDCMHFELLLRINFLEHAGLTLDTREGALLKEGRCIVSASLHKNDSELCVSRCY